MRRDHFAGEAMTRQQFLREFEGQLELPENSLNDSLMLADVEGWDSMAAVLFIALADEKCGVAISGNQIAAAKSINELLLLLGDGLTA
jgi:acyl carrier protein